MIKISISIGELADRLSILRIKSRYFDPELPKGIQVSQDLAQHQSLWDQQRPSTETCQLLETLETCNQMIWDLEERRRQTYQSPLLSKTDLFREDSIAICLQNDRRAKLKQEINQSHGSLHLEVKSHPGL